MATDSLELILLGTSSPIHTPHRFGPSQVVTDGRARLMVDVGWGSTVRGSRMVPRSAAPSRSDDWTASVAPTAAATVSSRNSPRAFSARTSKPRPLVVRTLRSERMDAAPLSGLRAAPAPGAAGR